MNLTFVDRWLLFVLLSFSYERTVHARIRTRVGSIMTVAYLLRIMNDPFSERYFCSRFGLDSRLRNGLEWNRGSCYIFFLLAFPRLLSGRSDQQWAYVKVKNETGNGNRSERKPQISPTLCANSTRSRRIFLLFFFFSTREYLPESSVFQAEVNAEETFKTGLAAFSPSFEQYDK